MSECNRYRIKTFFYWFLILFFFYCCDNNSAEKVAEELKKPDTMTNNSEAFELKSNTFRNPDQSFGYEIIQSGKTLIKQNNIPSVQGIKGFKSEDDAKKCGDFVIQKLKNNIWPPSVSAKELDSLGLVK